MTSQISTESSSPSSLVVVAVLAAGEIFVFIQRSARLWLCGSNAVWPSEYLTRELDSISSRDLGAERGRDAGHRGRLHVLEC